MSSLFNMPVVQWQISNFVMPGTWWHNPSLPLNGFIAHTELDRTTIHHDICMLNPILIPRPPVDSDGLDKESALPELATVTIAGDS